MNDISRRDFVAGALAGVACALTISGTTFGQTTKPSATDMGELAALKDGFNTNAAAASKKILLVKHAGKVYAVTGVCTHQGGTLRPVGTNALRCLKHGGMFDLDGKATKGPATGELCRYGITLQEGHLFVDINKLFLQGDFENPGAFVTVP